MKPQTIVKKLDPKLSPKDEAFKWACVLVAAANVGTDPRKLATELGWPLEEARERAAQCRKVGLFKRGKVSHSGWFDEESGGIAFWMDVMTARGLVERRP
jgi:hypothetical protein